MKSYKYIQTALLWVSGFVAVSCSQEEEFMAPNESGVFAISVIDSGVHSNDPKSRAVTDGEFKTTFVAGDQMGIYAVKENQVLETVENVCLTYDGSKWTVAGGGSLTYDSSQEGALYYAYYPYKADLAGFDATQVDPFETVVTNWVIGNDLEGDKYTVNDLMTSSGTTATGSGQKFELDLTLTHRMGLVVVELPAVTYTFTNEGMSPYTVGSSGIGFSINNTAKVPFYDQANAQYRLLIHPATELTIHGEFTNGGKKKYEITIEDGGLPAGKYAYYRIDGGSSSSTPVQHTLKMGDYFCADGSLVSVDHPAPANVVGIVYNIGTTDAIKADYPLCNHGLVYAVKRVEGEAAKWSVAQPTADWYGTGTPYNFEYVTNVIRGYEDTKIWMNIEDGEVADRDINSVMKSTLANYRTSTQLPSFTTGWYLPSYKELVDLQTHAGTINSSLTAASGDVLWVDAVTSDTAINNQLYWSSTVRRRDAVILYHPDKAANFPGYMRDYTGFYRYSFGF